ncbi:MAG: hypothetical protein M3464_06060 [Chloroflexota bacterium]|nr:hypothetical protein [Chloroflexota bacterium]
MSTIIVIERQLHGRKLAGLPTDGATAYVTATTKAAILDEFNSVGLSASSVTTMMADISQITTNHGQVAIVVDEERARDGIVVVGPEDE